HPPPPRPRQEHRREHSHHRHRGRLCTPGPLRGRERPARPPHHLLPLPGNRYRGGGDRLPLGPQRQQQARLHHPDRTDLRQRGLQVRAPGRRAHPRRPQRRGGDPAHPRLPAQDAHLLPGQPRHLRQRRARRSSQRPARLPHRPGCRRSHLLRAQPDQLRPRPPRHVSDPLPAEFVLIPPRQPDPEDPDVSTQDHRYPITVTFAPTELGTYSNSVVFEISDPANPQREIPLTGLGQRPCLKIEPEELDFGVVPPRCSTTELPIAVRNVCSEPLRVKGITFFHDAFPQFFEGWMPLFPRDLDPGADFDFNVFFRPDGTGFFEGHVEIVVVPADSDGNEGDPLVYPVRLYGDGRHDDLQTATWTQKDHDKVDVLWVIDTSGSMYDEQVLLSQQIPNFMPFAIEQKIDFHIGVTTTGVAYFPINSTSCDTGFNGDEDGRLFPHPNEGRPRFVHAGMSEATAVETLRANLQVG